MDTVLMEKECDFARSAILEAAGAIMRIAKESYSKAEEVDRSVVTSADVEADRILRESLTSQFPDYGWLSEETIDQYNRLECKRVWIVDPMDGTHEFVMNNPEFVTSVVLVENCRAMITFSIKRKPLLMVLSQQVQLHMI